MFAASKTASVSGGYQISRSLRFNKDDTTYLNRTPASAGNRTTWTWSAWVKRTNLSDFQYNLFGAATDGNNYDEFRFTTADKFRFFIVNSATIVLDLITTQLFRDPSAWYHLVVAYDSTQATASNRAKFYVNGVQVTTFDTATYPAQNTNSNFNSNVPAYIGYSTSNFRLNAYMTEVNFIDGQALTPSSFGETNAQTGVWQPKAYSGSYGTNGFYLNFSDNSNTTAATLGKDYSGNGNNWTPNNFSVTAGAGNDSLVDSPTSYGTDTGVGGTVRGNYATLNPLDTGSGVSLTNGNLDISIGGSHAIGLGTFMFSSGKWYAEYTISTTSSGNGLVGVCCPIANRNSYLGGTNGGIGMGLGSDRWINGVNSAGGLYATAGDVIGIALDMDNSQVSFYKNNTFVATITGSILTQPYAFAMGHANNSGIFNFGQRPFAYTAPSGFKALCTQNLPTPTIGATTATNANKYFDATLFTGTGAALSVVNAGGFQPDLVWTKNRSSAANHYLTNVLSGVSQYLVSDSTVAEQTAAQLYTSFNSNGFSMGTSGYPNGAAVVAWQWKANGSGSTNTSGSITSTVSANTTSGFSIVTYTATGSVATIGHGLGVAPSMVILKGRSGTTDWFVYHSSLGATNGIYLNQTGAAITSANFWNNTAPTSNVFTAGTGVGGSGVTEVAYCFAEVAGYSKFGSYTGNGSADGPFVYTGMRPAYVMIKRTDASADWFVFDTARNTYNTMSSFLRPNWSDAEATNTNHSIDFLSNGFKSRAVDTGVNASGGTYIYMAFATNPFKYSLAR